MAVALEQQDPEPAAVAGLVAIDEGIDGMATVIRLDGQPEAQGEAHVPAHHVDAGPDE
jgi:hypothetical protein